MGDPLPQFPQPTRPALSYDIEPFPAPLFPEHGFTQEFENPESLPLPKPSRPTSDYEIHPELGNYPIPEFLQDSTTDPEPNSTPSFERISYREEGSAEVFHHPESLSLPNSEIGSESRHTRFREPVESRDSDPDGTSTTDRISFSPSTGKTPKGEKEAVDELLMILVECMEELNTRSREALLRKFFSEIEREERLERFIIERLRQSRVKAISDLCEELPKRKSDEDSDLLKLNETEGNPRLTRSISESVEELSQKLERFKVKTLDLGGAVVREEESKK